MYESYWHLTRRPFDCEPDAEMYVESAAAESALLKLEYLINSGKGAGVLAGPSGTGKTFLTHVLEDRVRDRTGDFARLLYPRVETAGLVQMLCLRLGVPHGETEGWPLAALIERFRWRIHELCEDGDPPVVIIDDAQLIESPEVWHCLRMLLNVRDEPGCDFTLLLVGQPPLLGRVTGYPDLFERASVRVGLSPLTPEGVESYVRGRLTLAGVEDGVFDVDALESISDLSEGVPRRINQIADLSLLVGFADRLPMITRDQTEGAGSELRGVAVG